MICQKKGRRFSAPALLVFYCFVNEPVPWPGLHLAGLDRYDVLSLRAFLACSYSELYALAFGQSFEAGA